MFATFVVFSFRLVNDVQNVLAVQFQKPAFNDFGGNVLTANADAVPRRAAGFDHQLDIAVDRFRVPGVLPQEICVVDIFADQLPAVVHLFHPHPPLRNAAALAGRRRVGRGKDG